LYDTFESNDDQRAADTPAALRAAAPIARAAMTLRSIFMLDFNNILV
jgi:hypothetical protein